MLSGLVLGGFKAFRETQDVPLRPLTLIFGPNSSGKSTILQGLRLGCHAAATGSVDPRGSEPGSLDLGGFDQYVHGGDAGGEVTWGIQLAPGRSWSEATGGYSRTLEARIAHHPWRRQKDGRDGPRVNRYTLSLDGREFACLVRDAPEPPPGRSRPDGGAPFELRTVEDFKLETIDAAHPLLCDTALSYLRECGVRVSGQELLDAVRLWADSERWSAHGDFLARISVADLPWEPLDGHPITGEPEDLSDWRSGFLPKHCGVVLGLIHDDVRDALEAVRYLGPLRFFPSRQLLESALTGTGLPDAAGAHAWRELAESATLRAWVNEWLGSPQHLGTPYEVVVHELMPADIDAESMRKALLEVSDGLEDPTRESSLASAERLLEFIRSRSGGDPIRYLRLVDRMSGMTLSHKDIGMGISQMLPVLAACMGAEYETLAIEQPELHLHPALQAELGDLFIETALDGRENQVLIETHSEHLILRIMRRMRDTARGTLPGDVPPVTPEDVAVLYVEPVGDGSVVRRLELDEEGGLVDDWPGGFFEESFHERFS